MQPPIDPTRQGGCRSSCLPCIIAMAFLACGLFSCSASPVPVVGLPSPTTKASPHKRTAQPEPATGDSSVTPTPTVTMLSDKQTTLNMAHRYVGLILAKRYHSAYNLLSAEEQAQVSYNAFLASDNYILWPDCWDVSDYLIAQASQLTWDVEVLLIRLSCATRGAIACYDWHIHFYLLLQLPEIVSIGLYPSGVGPDCAQPSARG